MFKKIKIELAKPEVEVTEHGRFYRTPSGNLYPSVTTLMSYK